MKALAMALHLALTQDPQPEAEAPAPETPASLEAQDRPAESAPSATPVAASKAKGADEVTRALQKLPKLSPEEKSTLLNDLVRQFGAAETNPVLPSVEVDLSRYVELKPEQQALMAAQGFLTDLLAGDSVGLVRRSGYPFYLEAKKIDRPEELRELWGKGLRSRRVDLLKLYGVEILSPAEMEKKHGKPPARLSSWNWRAANGYLAVANLSGHAAILLLRPMGAAWQVVGFHD